MDKVMFCRLSGVSDQVLPGVQRREEDQLVHPGRAVNTLFTFLSQPECLDEPKAAFLRQRPDLNPGFLPRLSLAKQAQQRSLALVCADAPWWPGLSHPLGLSICSLYWTMDHCLPSAGTFQIPNCVTPICNSNVCCWDLF